MQLQLKEMYERYFVWNLQITWLWFVAQRVVDRANWSELMSIHVQAPPPVIRPENTDKMDAEYENIYETVDSYLEIISAFILS